MTRSARVLAPPPRIVDAARTNDAARIAIDTVNRMRLRMASIILLFGDGFVEVIIMGVFRQATKAVAAWYFCVGE